MLREKDFIQEKAVQIEKSDEENQVYCKWNNITLFNKTFACPSLVFAFTNRALFKINSVEYKSKEQKILSSHPVKPDRIQNLNRNLMSLTLSHQVERIAQQQNPNNPSTPESLIAIILVITMTNIHITLFIMCWYFEHH